MVFGFPERLFPRGKYDIHRMRVFALAISWISIVYNGIEGGVSIGMGAEAASRALIVFGVQSVVEVLSAALVIYRFHREVKENIAPNLILERRATLGIGVLFIILTLGTWAASIVALVTHAEPDSSIPSLIVSASALLLMIFVWLPKPWIATELNSSVMRGEAACSLACIHLTIVLFVGSLIYKLWHGGWWIDSAIAILLGFFFLHQGWDMISWARDKHFNGGCCKTCSAPSIPVSFTNNIATSNICNESSCKTCPTSSATVVSSIDNAATSDNCTKGRYQTCSATSPTVGSTNNTATSNNCNEGCCKTYPASSSTVASIDNTAASDNCKQGCCQTSSTPSPTVSSTSNIATSPIEYGNVEKCSCCASKKECIEGGTCLCRPLLNNTTLDGILCCSGPTKCCRYAMSAAVLL